MIRPRRGWLEGSLPEPAEMPIFSESNFAAFSMLDLDPSRTPMWSFGHTKFRERWIPVPLPPPGANLTLAHQFLSQLDDEIQDAVLGKRAPRFQGALFVRLH